VRKAQGLIASRAMLCLPWGMIFGCAALKKRPEKTLPRKRVII